MPTRYFENENDFLRSRKKGFLDSEIESLVYALNDTGAVSTIYSCEGHFKLGPDSFCHHNQKAQVRFSIRNLQKASALCDDILSSVIVDEIDVTVRQYAVKGEDDFEIQWSLEYRPVNYWDIRLQDQGIYVSVNHGWDEKRAQDLLRQAFNKTIDVCKKYQANK